MVLIVIPKRKQVKVEGVRYLRVESFGLIRDGQLDKLGVQLPKRLAINVRDIHMEHLVVRRRCVQPAFPVVNYGHKPVARITRGAPPLKVANELGQEFSDN